MTCVTMQVCKGYTSEYNSGQTCYLLVRAQLAIEYRSICFAVECMKRWLSVSSNFVPVWQCMPVVLWCWVILVAIVILMHVNLHGWL